jgi:hypothetical protein
MSAAEIARGLDEPLRAVVMAVQPCGVMGNYFILKSNDNAGQLRKLRRLQLMTDVPKGAMFTRLGFEVRAILEASK